MIVWEEQMAQWEAGISNPDRLAQLYRLVCRSSQQDARWMALLDAQEAKRVASSSEEEENDESGDTFGHPIMMTRSRMKSDCIDLMNSEEEKKEGEEKIEVCNPDLNDGRPCPSSPQKVFVTNAAA
jgi:hypothetical protein